MFEGDILSLGPFFAGSLFSLYVLSVLFRFALLGLSGTKFQQVGVVLLTGIVAIGFSGFGSGTGGFVNRITNLPNMDHVVAIILSAILIAMLVWWRTDDTRAQTQSRGERGKVGRVIALVFITPMILTGLGNLSGGVYSLAVGDNSSGFGLDVSRAEFRSAMLNGDLGPFWRMIDQRAPADMDFVIERVRAQIDRVGNVEQGQQIFNQEFSNYRSRIAAHAFRLTDDQRKDILQSSLDIWRAVEGRPGLCVDFISTGGQNLSKEQLLTAKDVLNRFNIVLFGSLLDAREAEADGKSVTRPPTEQDYGALLQLLYDREVPEDQIQALVNEDLSHPHFCQAHIAFRDAVIDLEGVSGEAIRFEIMQEILGATP